MGSIELKQHAAVAAGKLAPQLGALEKAYRDLRSRMAASRSWASVYDTARWSSAITPRVRGHSQEGRWQGEEREGCRECAPQL